MLFNLIIGIVMILVVSFQYGTSLIGNMDMTTLIYFISGNILFISTTGSMKRYFELFRISFLKSDKTSLSLSEAYKLNTYLVVINVMFGAIIYVLSKLTIFNNILDPTLIGPYTSFSLYGIIFPLWTITFILVPQRFKLSNLSILKE